MKVVLYPHGGSGNHGCEAIVCSTLDVLKADLTLFSSGVEEDYGYGLNRFCRIEQERIRLNRTTLAYWKSFWKYHVMRNRDAFDRLAFSPIIREASKADFALSIGGDNYCYGSPTYIYLINKELRKKGVKTILWGCSIEPKSIDAEMFDDLKGYTHIFARESITYQALIDSGIKRTSLFPDPAFVLNRIDLPLPNGFLEKEVVGINVSPMVIDRETCKGIIMRNYQRLVEYILETTTMNIVLIPHVVRRHNDDRKPLELLFSQFQNSHRVVMIGDHSAEVLKGFIARCRYMVAARTHASIAAYSEQVPSLVVGYSVKAVGIAKDIFGTADHYVIPVQNFTRDDDLVNHFKWLVANENYIKKHLRAFMPVYKEKVKGMKDILMSL